MSEKVSFKIAVDPLASGDEFAEKRKAVDQLRSELGVSLTWTPVDSLFIFTVVDERVEAVRAKLNGFGLFFTEEPYEPVDLPLSLNVH